MIKPSSESASSFKKKKKNVPLFQCRKIQTNFHILMSENVVAGFVHIVFFCFCFYLKSCSGLIWMVEVAPNGEQQQLLPAEVEL